VEIKLKLAFTLIELLVVIAIIGILSGLIVVAMGGVTNSANVAKSQVFSNSLRNALMANIVGEWKFDNISGTVGSTLADGTVVADSWSTNNGTTSGGPILKNGKDCVSGQCLSLDGSNDYVDCGSGANLNIGAGDFTVSLWINYQDPTLSSFDIGNLSSSHGWYLGMSQSSSKHLYYRGGYTSAINSSTAFSNNTWYNIVLTHLSTNAASMYVNGVLDTAGTVQLDSSAGNTNIGRIPAFPTTYLTKGSIDDVRIYNAAMPTSQIKEQYYAGLNGLLAKGGITEAEYLSRVLDLNSGYAKK